MDLDLATIPFFRSDPSNQQHFPPFPTLTPPHNDAPRFVYTDPVKRRDLEERLTRAAWWFLRRGGNHDVWTDGDRHEAIPRHREINERLAEAILRRVERRPN